MRVLITGATGTIGLAVVRRLRARGDEVVAVSRDPERGRRTLGGEVEVHPWADPATTLPPVEALRVDGIINLIGEPIDQRWSDEAKQRIHDSRVLSTRNLVAGLEQLAAADAAATPKVLVSQSAVGIYGNRGEQRLDESASAGSDWLAGLVVAWESAAMKAAAIMRVTTTRTGVVLSPSGGALAKMLPFFKLGVGGPVAGGHQYVPWVHLDDVAGGLVHCLDHEGAHGPVNLTAPEPVTNAALSRALGHALGRPAVLPVPGFAVTLLYGQMSELVTQGQRAIPAALEQLDYPFAHTDVEAALRDVVGH